MKEFIEELKKHGACEKLNAETWEDVSNIIFRGYTIEYLQKANTPVEFFRRYKEKVRSVFVDENVTLKNEDALLVNSSAEIEITDNSKVYNIVLMHGSKAKIKAGGYPVLVVTNIGGEYEIENDKTAVIL